MAEQDDELPSDCISSNPDVFSYFTLTSVIEKKRHGRFTVDACMSYTLVFVVLLIQSVLLYCVSDKVIRKTLQWQSGIISTGRNYNLVAEKTTGCQDASSLCTHLDGVMSCAPPSVQLIGRWDELDTDKDGTWTRSELMKSRDALKCKFAVDPVEMFEVLVAWLNERKKHIWLHSDIVNHKAIPKAYFIYIMGDIAMCGYRDADMCGNLMKRGVFDAALNLSTVPRIGNTAASALEYCHQLLDFGGLCERFLPSTYSTWKIESVQECKSPEFNSFVYKTPHTGVVKSLLEVDYQARQRYEVAKTTIFMTYKMCIVFIWILLVISQLRDVVKTLTWVLRIYYLKANLSTESAGVIGLTRSVSRGFDARESSLKNEEIHASVTHAHCVAMSVVTLFRVIMLCWLCCVGLIFLGTQTDYIGLLLDGIALLFIIDVEAIVYARVLRQDVRSYWEEREPIELPRMGIGFLSRRPDITDMVWLFVVICLAIAFQVIYTYVIVNPMYDALQCVCLSQGDACHEARRFSRSFWDQYWTHDVPNSREEINDLMAGLPLNDIERSRSTANASASLVQHVGRAVGKQFQGHLRARP